MKRCVLLLLAVCAISCAAAGAPAPVLDPNVISLLIVNQRGEPLFNVVVTDGRKHYRVHGLIKLKVSGPVVLWASKRGYGTSERQVFTPGERRIVLYEIALSDD